MKSPIIAPRTLSDETSLCKGCPMRGDMEGRPVEFAAKIVLRRRFNTREPQVLGVVGELSDAEGHKSKKIMLPRDLTDPDVIGEVLTSSLVSCPNPQVERTGLFQEQHSICPALAGTALNAALQEI